MSLSTAQHPATTNNSQTLQYISSFELSNQTNHIKKWTVGSSENDENVNEIDERAGGGKLSVQKVVASQQRPPTLELANISHDGTLQQLKQPSYSPHPIHTPQNQNQSILSEQERLNFKNQIRKLLAKEEREEKWQSEDEEQQGEDNHHDSIREKNVKILLELMKSIQSEPTLIIKKPSPMKVRETVVRGNERDFEDVADGAEDRQGANNHLPLDKKAESVRLNSNSMAQSPLVSTTIAVDDTLSDDSIVSHEDVLEERQVQTFDEDPSTSRRSSLESLSHEMSLHFHEDEEFSVEIRGNGTSRNQVGRHDDSDSDSTPHSPSSSLSHDSHTTISVSSSHNEVRIGRRRKRNDNSPPSPSSTHSDHVSEVSSSTSTVSTGRRRKRPLPSQAAHQSQDQSTKSNFNASLFSNGIESQPRSSTTWSSTNNIAQDHQQHTDFSQLPSFQKEVHPISVINSNNSSHSTAIQRYLSSSSLGSTSSSTSAGTRTSNATVLHAVNPQRAHELKALYGVIEDCNSKYQNKHRQLMQSLSSFSKQKYDLKQALSEI
uniref:Uncharacterized protein n=1 Tax=Percolomonas cosmopolitus TaxID=63605 RepID=A0A7S1KSQ3_9EUKA